MRGLCYQRAKQAQQPQIVTPGLDYGGLPIGRNSLGPAGEQFLEQTPWANPNHPSNAHLLQRQPSASHHVPQTAGHQPAMHGHVKVQRQAKDIVAAEADAVSIRHVNGPSSHAKPAAPAKKLPRAPEQAPPSQPSSAPVAGPSQPKVKTHMGQKAPQDAPVKTEALPAGVAV